MEKNATATKRQVPTPTLSSQALCDVLCAARNTFLKIDKSQWEQNAVKVVAELSARIPILELAVYFARGARALKPFECPGITELAAAANRAADAFERGEVAQAGQEVTQGGQSQPAAEEGGATADGTGEDHAIHEGIDLQGVEQQNVPEEGEDQAQPEAVNEETDSEDGDDDDAPGPGPGPSSRAGTSQSSAPATKGSLQKRVKKLESPAPEAPRGKRVTGKRSAVNDSSIIASGVDTPQAKRVAGKRVSSGRAVAKGRAGQGRASSKASGSKVGGKATGGDSDDEDQPGTSSSMRCNAMQVTVRTDPSLYSIDASTRDQLERTRSGRISRCRSGVANSIFAESDYYKNNPKSLLHDFAASIGKSLEQILEENDKLWNSIPKLKEQMLLEPKKYLKEDFDAIEAGAANSDDPDYHSLLLLLTFLKRRASDKPLNKLDKICRIFQDGRNPAGASRILPAHLLVFRTSSDSPHYLGFNGAPVPIFGGLRVAMLALIAAAHIFDAEFNDEVYDCNCFFWVGAKLSLKWVTVNPNVRNAYNIVNRAD